MKTNSEQMDLICSDPPIFETKLISPDSPKKAYYVVSVHMVPGGYIVRKQSGAEQATPVTECYWRPGLRQAMDKYTQLLDTKLHKRKGRIYSVAVVKEEETSHEMEKT